jgi:hypothetical protein
MTLAALFIVSNLLMPGDDEDKNQIGGLRWFAAYETLRLRKEIGAMVLLNPTAYHDNWRIINNPSAAIGYWGRWLDVFGQAGSDLANLELGRYKRDYGLAEEGDTKLFHAFRKVALGTMYQDIDLEEQVKNLTR